MSQWLRWAAAAGLSLSLAACVPEFEQALDGGNPADPALVGTYDAKGKDDSESMVLEIAAKDGGLTVALKDPKGSEQINFKGRSAEIGGVTYVSLTPSDPEAMGAGSTEIGYMIFRYAPEGAGYTVWALDGEKVSAAVESGALKGTVTGSGSEKQPKITSSASEIAAWIATSEGQAAFDQDDALILKRMTP